MMSFEALKKEVLKPFPGERPKKPWCWYAYLAYREHFDDPVPIAKGYAAAARFVMPDAFVYDDDLIAGSIRGALRTDLTDIQYEQAAKLCDSYGVNTFRTNADHFAPDYVTFLSRGVAGTISDIERSSAVHRIDPDAEKKQTFLAAARIAMEGFREMLAKYAAACRQRPPKLRTTPRSGSAWRPWPASLRR